ncbi:hypothetical protein TSUD_325180 [Trifolium subterraneum]|uniref:Uncharacterized protein n=1 Tax=Trifolium subterraneum TaxID=3900 RepID=A0A2Z6N990_TRISU|nr:hypothetical protein TSUD_325180 [Trifolium subterraneum]
MANVYVPCDDGAKQGPWDSLSERIQFLGGGGFVSAGITMRLNMLMNAARHASSFIEDNNLIDLPLSGRKFTWFKGDGLAMCRLDRMNASISWQQSFSLWLKEEDANSKYFHSVLAGRRRGNVISVIQVNGVTLEEVTPIRQTVFSHFASHFKVVNVDRPRVDNLQFKRLNQLESGSLIKPFSEAEVRAAVWDSDSYKTPGPYGVNFGFFKDFWDALRSNVIRFISEFRRNGKLTKGEAASALCCKVGNIPFLYLGLPIGDDPRCLGFWEPVLARLKKILSGWKSRFLSFGGLLVLIKSVLTSLHVYALSFFKAPSEGLWFRVLAARYGRVLEQEWFSTQTHDFNEKDLSAPRSALQPVRGQILSEARRAYQKQYIMLSEAALIFKIPTLIRPSLKDIPFKFKRTTR